MDVAEMLLQDKVDKINEKLGANTVSVVFGERSMLYIRGELIGGNVTPSALIIAIDAMYHLVTEG